MKHTRVAVFISLLLALLLFGAAMPAQAQWQGTVPDFKYDGLTADGHWKFSWDVPINGYWYEFEFHYKGGGVNVWTSVSSLATASARSTREAVSTQPLHNAPAGKTFKFRVRAKFCHFPDAAGNCGQEIWYNWAKISVTF